MRFLVVFAVVSMFFASGTRAQIRDHGEVRQFVIRNQLDQAGEGPIVFIGDSITETALLPEQICGHRVVNAGVGGTTALSYLQQIIRGIPRFDALVIVIALGTNDAINKSSAKQFTDDYLVLARILQSYSSNLLFAGIPPIENGYLSDKYPASNGEEINGAIRNMAAETSHAFIDLRSELSREHNTIDGVHLSPAGYQVWKKIILQRVRSALKC